MEYDTRYTLAAQIDCHRRVFEVELLHDQLRRENRVGKLNRTDIDGLFLSFPRDQYLPI